MCPTPKCILHCRPISVYTLALALHARLTGTARHILTQHTHTSHIYCANSVLSSYEIYVAYMCSIFLPTRQSDSLGESVHIVGACSRINRRAAPVLSRSSSRVSVFRFARQILRFAYCGIRIVLCNLSNVRRPTYILLVFSDCFL